MTWFNTNDKISRDIVTLLSKWFTGIWASLSLMKGRNITHTVAKWDVMCTCVPVDQHFINIVWFWRQYVGYYVFIPIRCDACSSPPSQYITINCNAHEKPYRWHHFDIALDKRAVIVSGQLSNNVTYNCHDILFGYWKHFDSAKLIAYLLLIIIIFIDTKSVTIYPCSSRCFSCRSIALTNIWPGKMHLWQPSSYRIRNNLAFC